MHRLTAPAVGWLQGSFDFASSFIQNANELAAFRMTERLKHRFKKIQVRPCLIIALNMALISSAVKCLPGFLA